MGNCLRRESDKVWAGEDWGCVDRSNRDTNGGIERLRLLHHEMSQSTNTDNKNNHNHNNISRQYHNNSNNNCNSNGNSREVKIKISKKELEELVGGQDMTMNELLSYLIINGHDRPDHAPHFDHQRSWRPALQSIPEVN